jgi:hypothetical protein
MRQFDVPAGKTDQDVLNTAVAYPIEQELVRGTFGFAGLYNSLRNFGAERILDFGYASRGLYQFDAGELDFGAALKILGTSYDAGKGAAHGTIDLGGLYRFGDRYAVGVSLIDATRPGFRQPDGFHDRAPFAFKLGFTETMRDFLLTLDATKREPSGRHPGAASLGGGLERWWSTPRSGSFAVRTGMNLGDRDKTWSWGLGWRVFGGQIDYAMTVPMQGATAFGHSVGMTFHFGASNPEAEYERVLSEELRYRQELSKALEAGEVKQWRLGEELGRQREELEALRAQLSDKTLSEAQARDRIKDVERRHQEAVDRFEKLQAESKRLAERSQQAAFDDDWNAYIKLKASGAPDAVLVDQIKRILREYRDKGVDLSGANQELVRLLRAKTSP